MRSLLLILLIFTIWGKNKVSFAHSGTVLKISPFSFFSERFSVGNNDKKSAVFLVLIIKNTNNPLDMMCKIVI